VSDYYCKMKSMVDSLADLGCAFSNRNLVLNVLRGLKSGMIIFKPSSRATHRSHPSTRVGTTWSWRKSRTARHTCASPAGVLLQQHSCPHLPLLCLIPLLMVARVKDRVMTVATITRTVTTMVATVATTLPARVTRTRVASLALPCLLGPPLITLGLGPSTCTSI
jgi:hypothetical protein